MIKSKLKPVALAVLLAGISPAMLSNPVSAAVLQEKVTVKAGRTISPREEEIVSSAATKVLRHIAQARSDIHKGDATAAKEQLNQVQILLEIIQTSLPTTRVKDRIWVARKHLEYEDTQDVLPDLIPISASLDELVDVLPVKISKQHLSKAGKHLKAGDKEKARKELEATDAALEYTEVDLPLNITRDLVKQAIKDLGNKKNDSAAQALKSAEDSVVFMSFDYQQPLFTAKAMLWQTMVDLDAGNKDMAKADLQSAISNLKAAGETTNKATREAARDLLGTATQLQADMKAEKDIAGRVQHLWERTKAFTDRSMAYLASGWERYRSDKPFKSDLIEARLHLTNARIDMFTGQESVQAKQELASALKFLSSAERKAQKDSSYKVYVKQMKGIASGLEKLRAEPAKEKIDKYVNLEADMSTMIRTL